VIFTESSKIFIDFNEFLATNEGKIEVYQDSNEYGSCKKKGDPVLHTDLRNWADIFLIASLSVNTMAKISNRICDNLLTVVMRAWKLDEYDGNIFFENMEYSVLRQPVILAPAMNTDMYNHPITEK